MNELSKIILLVTCLYLLLVAARLPQLATAPMGRHHTLGAIAVSGLVAASVLAAGLLLAFILV